MGKIAYGVCVGSWEKVNSNIMPRIVDQPLTLTSGHTAIAPVYNRILDLYRGRDDLDALILLHDDLEITDPAAEAKFLEPLQDPDVALVGVAGGPGHLGLAWWNTSPIGHQMTDVMNLDFGQRAGDVDILEGSILVFSPWAIDNLRFDERFPGFHTYDEIGMQARRQDKRVVVVDVDTHHHTAMGFKSEQSHLQWLEGDRRYREKWGL